MCDCIKLHATLKANKAKKYQCMSTSAYNLKQSLWETKLYGKLYVNPNHEKVVLTRIW